MPGLKISSYTVQDPTEECCCAWCGAPLYVGDKVYTFEDDDRPTCCKFCAVSLWERSVVNEIWKILDHKG